VVIPFSIVFWVFNWPQSSLAHASRLARERQSYRRALAIGATAARDAGFCAPALEAVTPCGPLWPVPGASNRPWFIGRVRDRRETMSKRLVLTFVRQRAISLNLLDTKGRKHGQVNRLRADVDGGPIGRT
jgi:hypothetical protein